MRPERKARLRCRLHEFDIETLRVIEIQYRPEPALSSGQRWALKLSICTAILSVFFSLVLPSIPVAIMSGYVTAFLGVTGGAIVEVMLKL